MSKIIKKVIVLIILTSIMLYRILPLKSQATKSDANTTNNLFDKDITFESEYVKDGNYIPYELYTPSTASKNESLPLIIWLHGMGEFGVGKSTFKQSGLLNVLNQWESLGMEGFAAYILCPHSSNSAKTWTNNTEMEKVKNLIDYIIKEKNIDTSNIIMTGHSSGANGAAYMTYNMPEYFSKCVLLSGFNTYKTPEEFKALGIETRAYTGKSDMGDSVAFTRDKFEPTFGSQNTFWLEKTDHSGVPKQAFIMDKDNNGRSDLIEWMFDGYVVTSSGSGTGSSSSSSTQYDYNYSNDIESPTTGLDTVTGLMLEPTVEFFTVVIDYIMSIFSSVMTQSEFEFVMVNKDEINTIPDLGEPGTVHVISNMEPYKSASGSLDKLQYPRFTYSAEEVFSGKINLLDVNFIDDSNTDEDWNKIRSVIASWYKVLRMVAIIGLLSVLIYTGIKIIISSNTKDKAKYKELIINWFIAVVLVFTLHYIMAFILSVVEEIMQLLQGMTGVIGVNAGGTSFETNLIGLARFKLQQQHFTAKVGYLVIYTALVVYTFKFTFLYLKRVLRMAFLTVISPVVALTYPIDKANNGKAQGFELWIKEFLFNALLQPLHYVLYYILVSSSLSLAANNPIYGIVALMFISNAEKLLKRIFGFDKAKGGTVGGIAGAYATGAIASKVAGFAKDPLHPFKGGKKGKSGKGKGSKGSSSDDEYDYNELPNDLKDDFDFENFLPGNITGNPDMSGTQTDGGTPEPLPQPSEGRQSELDEDNEFFSNYRIDLSQYSNEELGGLYFNDGDSRSFLEMLQQLSQYSAGNFDYSDESIDDLRELLQYRLMANENGFEASGIMQQYIDGDSRSSSALLNDITRLNGLAMNSSYSDEDRAKFASQAQDEYKVLERRMIENQYIQKQGGPEALLQQQTQASDKQQDNLWKKFKNAPVTKGMANVGKTILKPAWDVEKSTSYNAKRLVGHAGTLAKATLGASVGIAAAAVQAGISITDGKYNPLEGVATVAAGVAGVTGIKGNGELKRAYREGANQGEDGKSLEEYSERWFNRDDTIEFYNKEFPGRGKEMRQRAVDNYISRGITDVKEQKKAMKFANLLQEERGMDRDEADKLAVATLQYKQNLAADSNYKILFDAEKRQQYLDAKADAYTGSASKASVKQLHKEFIQNVRDFDRANR